MSQSTASVCAADLWDRFSYSPLTGKFYRRRTGKVVPGTAYTDYRNYRGLRIRAPFNGKLRTVPYGRAVYAWLTGTLPGKGFHIDHINHDSHDNRPSNLRCVTVRENNQNRRNQGSAGIYWNKRINRWQAQIRIQGKKVYLGVFKEESEALERYIHACDANNYSVLDSVRHRLESLTLLAD
jgi:hypothetical protein